MPGKEVWKSEGNSLGRSVANLKGAYPLPTPPMRSGGINMGIKSEERKESEVKRSSGMNERLSSLKAQRRAQGLCYICAEKWSPTHKCSNTVQLHAVQELFTVLHESAEDGLSTTDHVVEQTLMAVSLQAVQGSETGGCMRMLGQIQSKEILILVDSGSSASFISKRVASSLIGVLEQPVHVQVKVAGGAMLHCCSEILNCEWTTQGHVFFTNLKVLELNNYDMILGMDWLMQHSPMTVDWTTKSLIIACAGTQIQLHGVRSDTQQCAHISSRQFRELNDRTTVSNLVQFCSVFALEHQEQIPNVVQTVLTEFSSVFDEPKGLPPIRQFDHTIPLLPGAGPVNVRPYRYTPVQKNEIESQVQEMLSKWIIQPCSSPFSSPVLLVKKKDGSWRFCVDYRHLNAITVKNKYPLPVIDELLDELAGAQWFSKLDLRSEYHQIRMHPDDEHKTAFQTHHGHFEFRVLPFGLTSAPATFQGVMNSVLATLLRRCVLVFVDDILIYSKSLEEHVQHLKTVFQILLKHQLKVKRTKCSFAQQELAYLEHIIQPNGVSTDPEKIQVIQHWPAPTSVKELRSFLGLSGYYRKFVRNYGILSKPLTNLLRNGQLYIWTTETEDAFQALKQALITAPVLAMPDFQTPFVVETDASDKGIGAVLMQNNHPLAFLSRALGLRHQGLSTYEKESLAIMLAVDHWRPYLQHDEFFIRTDHRSLAFLTEQRLTTPWQHKALTKLLGLRYKIIFKKGVDNNVADALSRYPGSDQVELSALSIVVPEWINEIVAGYSSDPDACSKVQTLCINSGAVPNFSLHNGVLYFQNRLWVGHNVEVQQKILANLHTTAVGGHSGIQVTYQRVKQLFAWPRLRATVVQYVQACSVCQQAKSEHVKYPGMLQPLPVPDHAWQIVSLDFVEGLPKSASFNCILVVVDKFSKYSHFVPLTHPFSALDVAEAYMQHIHRLHGLPQSLISDRDRIFTSTLWTTLFKLAGTQLRMSSSYHPQTDGQTERVNKCLETFLRCFVHACPSQWSRWLALAEYWYNTSFHSAVGTTPFEVLYGHKPRYFGLSASAACRSDDLVEWLHEREKMQALIRDHLLRAQTRMKQQADQHRSEHSFAVGDWVYLKL